MIGKIKLYHSLLFLFFIISINPSEAGKGNIKSLKSLTLKGNISLKSLRNDIKKSIYIVKSGRPADELPGLRFVKYRVKKGDSFWVILSRTSLDMDTLISVNSLSNPRDVVPGKILFIPNMRGIITRGTEDLITVKMKKQRVKRIYVNRVNRTDSLVKRHIFIPCGKLSNLERSLFLGTGFMYPLKKGRRSSGFGMRRNPFNKRNFHFHSGVDIACSIKSKVYAARSGTVVFSGYKGGYGKLVIVRHEYGYMSYYGHLSRSMVKAGDRVNRGDVIALTGNTGRTTGPHLHFEIRKKNRPVNPGILLRREGA